MDVILEILSFLTDVLLSPWEMKDIRAKRRQEMEDLDRPTSKDWERFV